MKTSDAIVALAKRGIGTARLINAALVLEARNTVVTATNTIKGLPRDKIRKIQKAADDAYTMLTSFDGITAAEHQRVVKQLKEAKELLAI